MSYPSLPFCSEFKYNLLKYCWFRIPARNRRRKSNKDLTSVCVKITVGAASHPRLDHTQPAFRLFRSYSRAGRRLASTAGQASGSSTHLARRPTTGAAHRAECTTPSSRQNITNGIDCSGKVEVFQCLFEENLPTVLDTSISGAREFSSEQPGFTLLLNCFWRRLIHLLCIRLKIC